MTPRGGRVVAGDRAEARRHWDKAVRFAESARHAAAAGHWDPCCSDAVLSVIHLADAVSLHFRGQRSASQNHFDAAELVEQVTEMDAATKTSFLHHLHRLLRAKGIVQYSSRAFGRKDAELALQHLDRAFAALRSLAVKAGWK